MKRVLAPFAFLALIPLLGVTSCASVFSDYCDKEVSCAGGNDKDKSACADSLRGDEKAASDYGCADQFDAVYTCRNNGTCDPTNKRFQTACDVQKKALDDCIAANSALR
jgi:hypothetical protein